MVEIIDIKELKQIIGHRITMVRTYHKLTQQEFGEKLGVNQRRVSTWESGSRLIPLDHLVKIKTMFA